MTALLLLAAGAPAVPATAAPSVVLAFAGDVHFEAELAPRLKTPRTALKPVAPILRGADVAMVNLESAITSRGRPEPKKFTFRTSPKALDALAAAGVVVVSMANNHAVDYGAQGLTDTLAAQRTSPIPVVGIGSDAAAAFAPANFEVRGTSIAVLGATQVPDRTAATWAAGEAKPGVASARNPKRLLAAVRTARVSSDLVVVYLHYGTERVACPARDQRDVVERLAKAGADVVVGSHAHVLLGSGWKGGTYVNYGLGNFVWYSPNSRAEATSGVLKLTWSGGEVVADALVPTYTGRDGLPRPVKGKACEEALADWRALRPCTGLAAQS
ncbi:MAG: CapA family protein [Sporichthyaceae bacterium]